jgi:hypothetical protein
MRNRRAKVAASISCLFFTFSGCESFTTPKPARIGEEQRYLVHLVTGSNESFGKISKWYTGNEKFGKDLAQLNSKIAGNGLQVGESVLIPFTNLKTVAPMPKVVGTKKGKSTKRGKKKGSSPPALDSVELHTSEIESEPNSPETYEVEVHQNQPDMPSDEAHILVQEEQKILTSSNERDVVPLPTAPENEAKGGDNLGNGGKSLEDLVREEQAELERLKREMDAQ